MLKNLFFVLISLALLSGCASTQAKLETKEEIKQVNVKETKIEPLKAEVVFKEARKKNEVIEVKKAEVIEEEPLNINTALMDFYKEWKHVKYRYGGNSKKGIDCSAFTQRVFKEKLNIKIPRTTLTQVKVGKKIKRSELELGDLVFFRTGVRDRHVGIYMGNGDFMHASIKGIKFTKLDKPYYKRKYWTSRRIMN